MIPLILASSSPSRLKLLKQIRIEPDLIYPPDIDEKDMVGEKPIQLALRLAVEKAICVAEKQAEKQKEAYILAADTVTAVGRRILPKAINDELVMQCLSLISGRRNKVYTGVCVIKKQGDSTIIRKKVVTTTQKIKRLTPNDIKQYIQIKEGINKSGGCMIEGMMGSFVEFINGSYSNIVGLPLYETRNMLTSLGFNNFKLEK